MPRIGLFVCALFAATGYASTDSLVAASQAKAATHLKSAAKSQTKTSAQDKSKLQAKTTSQTKTTASLPHGPSKISAYVAIKHSLKRVAAKDLHPRHHRAAPKEDDDADLGVPDDSDIVGSADMSLASTPSTDADPVADVSSEDVDASNTDAAPQPPQPKAQPEAPKVDVAMSDDDSTSVVSQPQAAKVDTAMTDDDTPSTASQLKQELAEAVQRRSNVAQLERALAADIALLREGTALRRISVSRRGRAAADRQVRESEQVVKDTGNMLRASREAAAEDARGMLREAADAKAAAEQMEAEAREQLRLFGSSTAAAPHSDADSDSQPPAAPAHHPLRKKIQKQQRQIPDDMDEIEDVQ